MQNREWDATMLLMAPKKKPGRPPKPRQTEAIQIRVDPALARAIEELAARNRHSRTGEIVQVLEEKLRAEGLWPPKPDAD